MNYIGVGLWITAKMMGLMLTLVSLQLLKQVEGWKKVYFVLSSLIGLQIFLTIHIFNHIF